VLPVEPIAPPVVVEPPVLATAPPVEDAPPVLLAPPVVDAGGGGIESSEQPPSTAMLVLAK
jgi:hypothetical protein